MALTFSCEVIDFYGIIDKSDGKYTFMLMPRKAGNSTALGSSERWRRLRAVKYNKGMSLLGTFTDVPQEVNQDQSELSSSKAEASSPLLRFFCTDLSSLRSNNCARKPSPLRM